MTSPPLHTFTFTDSERRVFRGREIDPVTGRPITVSAFAARYRYVTTGRIPGLWRNDITPYAVEPMDCWSTPYIRKIFLPWPPKTGKTQIAFNCLAWSVDQNPGPIMYVQPDENKAKTTAKRSVKPIIDRSPRLATLRSPRAEDNTLTLVRLLNGADIMFRWASSAAALSDDEARDMIFDEIDKYDETIGNKGREGDVIAYAEMRQNSFPHTKKGLYISSPSAYPSRITALIANEADQIRRLYARCPYCGTGQRMSDDHFILTRRTSDPRAIIREKLGRYSCDKCGIAWDDYARNLAVRAGYWQPEPSSDGTILLRPEAVAFLMPAWYSPEISLSTCVADKLRAESDPARKHFYVTQRKAEEYNEVIAEKTEDKILAQRCSGYDGLTPKPPLPRLVVPREALALTAGIDTQKHGFWYVIDAWSANLDSWMIDHGKLETFEDLERLIWQTTYPIDGTNGTEVMSIWRAAIDTGGGKAENIELTRTEEVYEWLRRQTPGRIFGIKGMSKPQTRRIVPSVKDKFPHTNRPIPGGLELRLIDSGQFKLLIHQRLDRDPQEIGQHIFLHADTGVDFARQIMAEQLRSNPKGHKYWHKVHSANHLLDCKAYSAACVDAEWTISFQALIRAFQEHLNQREAPSKAPDSPATDSTTSQAATSHRRW